MNVGCELALKDGWILNSEEETETHPSGIKHEKDRLAWDRGQHSCYGKKKRTDAHQVLTTCAGYFANVSFKFPNNNVRWCISQGSAEKPNQ